MTQSNFNALMERIVAARPSHEKFVHEAIASLTPAEVGEGEAYIDHLLEQHEMQYLVGSYLTILDDTMEAQIEFLREKRYRHSRFDEVAAAVYFNREYMTKYMIGLAITEFLWPNHILIRRFFAESFPETKTGSYLEVGPGHGFFLLHAMKKGSLDRFLGIDISAASIALTDEIVSREASELRSKLELRECDFLAPQAIDEKFDVIVMGEVLEHVEDPLAFLKGLKALAAPGAHIFITTCLNAPAIDHIYLFRTQSDVADLFAAAGMTIKDQRIIPHPGQSLERCVKNDLPINVAYVLE